MGCGEEVAVAEHPAQAESAVGVIRQVDAGVIGVKDDGGGVVMPAEGGREGDVREGDVGFVVVECAGEEVDGVACCDRGLGGVYLRGLRCGCYGWR